MTTEPNPTPMSLDVMLEDLRTLVECESPSDDLAATARCAEVLADLGQARMGAAPERVRVGERVHLLWRWGTGPMRTLVVGHYDTVWPMGTLKRWPFSVSGDRATGPGTLDMKAGVIQALHAIASLPERDGVGVLLTADEEIGSPDSRELIESLAREASAVFVPEASADGALKIERKGVSLYTVEVGGRAAHAGLEPEKGVNATVEVAHQVLAIIDMASPEAGTSVTPTVVNAGTTTNTVAAAGRISVDVRARTQSEQERVDAAMQALQPVLPGARLTVLGRPNRPPLERGMSEALHTEAVATYAELGFGELQGVSVGGASDGNFTAGVGAQTLDGIGAVGDGAHAEGEWASIPDMPRRSALLAALVRAHQRAG